MKEILSVDRPRPVVPWHEGAGQREFFAGSGRAPRGARAFGQRQDHLATIDRGPGVATRAGTLPFRESRLPAPAKCWLRRNAAEVALVFQDLALFPHLNALDQIAFAARGRGGIKQAKVLLDPDWPRSPRPPRRSTSFPAANASASPSRGRSPRSRNSCSWTSRSPVLTTPSARKCATCCARCWKPAKRTLILVTHSRDDALDLSHAGSWCWNRPAASSPADRLQGAVMLRPQSCGGGAGAGSRGRLWQEKSPRRVKPRRPLGRCQRLRERATEGRVQLLCSSRPAENCHVSDEVDKGSGFESGYRPPEARRGSPHRRGVRVAGETSAPVREVTRHCPWAERIRVRIDDECELLEG